MKKVLQPRDLFFVSFTSASFRNEDPPLNFSSRLLFRGGRGVRWCWVNFQCRGVLLIWIRVGQGLTALAVGAGGDCLDIFFSSIICLWKLVWLADLGFTAL